MLYHQKILPLKTGDTVCIPGKRLRQDLDRNIPRPSFVSLA
jgi:hypothetical protein